MLLRLALAAIAVAILSLSPAASAKPPGQAAQGPGGPHVLRPAEEGAAERPREADLAASREGAGADRGRRVEHVDPLHVEDHQRQGDPRLRLGERAAR